MSLIDAEMPVRIEKTTVAIAYFPVRVFFSTIPRLRILLLLLEGESFFRSVSSIGTHHI